MDKQKMNTNLDEINAEKRGENLQGDRILSGKGNTDILNARSENQSEESEKLDRQMMESFPSSDPPANY